MCLSCLSWSFWQATNGKSSKTLNTFLFLFSNKMLLMRAGIHKVFVRITNKEDPDQTFSLEKNVFFRSSLILVCPVCVGFLASN